MSKPRILLLDIETLPNLGYTWGLYEQNVIRFVKQGCIATFAAKWLDKPAVFAKSLPDYKGYKPGSYDDKALVKDIWNLLDEADVVVAHNGDSFDARVCRARFIYYGFNPPSPFKTVDTKKAAKRVARFNSNKLDDLGQLFEIGQKIKTDFDLWEGCIEGDPVSWAKMVSYNKKDVILLEKLYKRLLPWISNHPNYGVLDRDALCPKCGSRQVNFRGYAVTQARKYRRFQCIECGGWGRLVTAEKGSSVKTTNLT